MKYSYSFKLVAITAVALLAFSMARASDVPKLTIESPSEGQTIQPTPGLGPVAIIKFKTDNFKIESLDKGHGSMTDMATEEHPNHGHIHVTVDDNSWYFVHSDNDPVVLAGLSPGQHSVKLQLAGPNHMPVGTSQTVSFIIGSGSNR